MRSVRWHGQVGGIAGIAFVIVLVVGFVIYSERPPGFEEAADDVAAFVGENRGEIQAATALSTIAAGPFFLLFLAALTRLLRIAEGAGPGMLAPVAFAGGILLGAFAVTGWGLQWASSYHELDAQVVQGLWDAGTIAFVASAGIGFTLLIGASSAVMLTTGVLPRALGAFGALVAAYSFVVAIVATFTETGAFSPADGALPLIAFLGLLVWVLLASIALLTHTGPTHEPAARPSPTPPAS